MASHPPLGEAKSKGLSSVHIIAKMKPKHSEQLPQCFFLLCGIGSICGVG